MKEKISCLRVTQAERNLGVGDLRQELFQKTRSSAAMLIPTTPLTPTLPNSATTTTHIINEKKSKKRAAEDYRHGNIKIQRGLVIMTFQLNTGKDKILTNFLNQFLDILEFKTYRTDGKVGPHLSFPLYKS